MGKAVFTYDISSKINFSINLLQEDFDKLKDFAKGDNLPYASVFRDFLALSQKEDGVISLMPYVQTDTKPKTEKWKTAHFSVKLEDIEELRKVAVKHGTTAPRLFRAYLRLKNII